MKKIEEDECNTKIEDDKEEQKKELLKELTLKEIIKLLNEEELNEELKKELLKDLKLIDIIKILDEEGSKTLNKRANPLPKNKIYWTAKEAIEFAASVGIDITKQTIYKWCSKFGIGHRVGGHINKLGKRSYGSWEINSYKFQLFLRGQGFYEIPEKDRD